MAPSITMTATNFFCSYTACFFSYTAASYACFVLLIYWELSEWWCVLFIANEWCWAEAEWWVIVTTRMRRFSFRSGHDTLSLCLQLFLSKIVIEWIFSYSYLLIALATVIVKCEFFLCRTVDKFVLKNVKWNLSLIIKCH